MNSNQPIGELKFNVANLLTIKLDGVIILSCPETTILFWICFCANGSVVEHRLAKARAASSNLVSRLQKPVFTGFFYFAKTGHYNWVITIKALELFIRLTVLHSQTDFLCLDISF